MSRIKYLHRFSHFMTNSIEKDTKDKNAIKIFESIKIAHITWQFKFLFLTFSIEKKKQKNLNNLIFAAHILHL